MAFRLDILAHSNVTEITQVLDPTLAAVVSLYNTCEQDSFECAYRVWNELPLAMLRTYAERKGLSSSYDNPVQDLYERIQKAFVSLVPAEWFGTTSRVSWSCDFT